MSTFTVQGILSHPDRRDGERVVVDFLVGTRASYMVLPAEIVEQLAPANSA